MTTAIEKLLLSELRLVTFEEPDGGQELTDTQITRAMTVNEELRNLGFTLTPADLLRLAGSRSLTGFADRFRSLLPDVSAPPMYPDFPLQVMEMDEAQFRLHQLIHYFSTYDLEALFGVEVQKGWLPEVSATAKTEKDDALLEAKVLELIAEDEAAITSLRRILGKRERMTKPEAELVSLLVPYLKPEDLAGIRVPFKENLTELFDAILVSDVREERILFWRQICQHTGDVMKCVLDVLPRHHFHLSTSRKKAIVKLLETYPAADFRANLILSRTKREKNLVVLQYLDYNEYSRSAAHKEAVRALRNGELRSWEAQAKYLLSSGNDGALDFIAARPGMMLRMLRWLLRMGYPAEEVRGKLLEKSGAISLHTVVDILNALDSAENREPKENLYRASLHSMEKASAERVALLKRQMQNIDWRTNVPSRITRHHILRNFERKERLKIEKYKGEYEAARTLYEKSSPYNKEVCGILRDVLQSHLEQAKTELYGKKVYLQQEAFDLSFSRLKAEGSASEGGYLPPGVAIKIPDTVRYVRFFVYWDDEHRVDLDLHAMAHDLEGNDIHVGWNAAFNKDGIVHSGDITHSNAAEYIDIDLKAPLRDAETFIHIYYGKNAFNKIRTCYVGMMAVSKIGKNVALYDPKNCFFTHELRSEGRKINYGYIDVPRRLLFFVGNAQAKKAPAYCESGGLYREKQPLFSLEEYLDLLMAAQKVTRVQSPEEADVLLTLEKAADEKTVSLIDRNFYLEA